MNTPPARGYVVVRQLLPLTIVAMEFAWAFPWVLLLTGAFYGATAAPLLPPLPAFGLLLGGFLTVRAAVWRPWPLVHARAGVVAVGVVAGLAAVKSTYYAGYAAHDLRWIGVLLRAAHDALPAVAPAVMGALMATVWWWRGVVLGEREFNYFEVDRAFRRGVGWSVAFVVLLALYGTSRGFALTQPAPAYFLAFFSLSLTVLAITRLLSLWEETQADPAQALAMNRHWLLLLVGVVGLIFALAGVLAGGADVAVRAALLQVLRPLAPAVEFVFYVLFALATVVARVIVFVFARLPFRRVTLPPTTAAPPALRDLLRDLPPEVVSGARWGMVLVVVAVLAVLVAISVVRAHRRRPKPRGDERESVWSSEAALRGLGGAWWRLWKRLRPPRLAPDAPAVASIRALYRELLRTGREIGAPRRPDETPYEYRPRLSGSLVQAAADVFMLTEAYVRVRYTPATPSEEDIRRAQDALERIRTVALPTDSAAVPRTSPRDHGRSPDLP